MHYLPLSLDSLRKDTWEVVRNVGLGPRKNSSARRVHITGSTEARGRVHLSKDEGSGNRAEPWKHFPFMGGSERGASKQD